ncbi:MAG: response regulator transcription factor [Treponema sp.]|jgi:DNA-binding NarL/FixJ family response regulator|nr:response regulator transcription factor [Treponema sp.]
MITIAIIDSNETARYTIKDSLSSQSDFDIIGIGKDCYEALKIVKNKQPDIVIMDIVLRDEDSVALIPLLKSLSPRTSIVLLTDIEDEEHIYKALIQRPAGYIIKHSGMPTLCRDIKHIYQGDCFISSQVASKICVIFSQMEKRGLYPETHRYTAKQPYEEVRIPSCISGVELRIIAFIAQGYSTHEIAEKLSITDATTRNYISIVMRKTGLHNRAQLTIFAIRHGLISV